MLDSVPGNLAFEPNNLASLVDCLKRLDRDYDQLVLAAEENRQGVRAYSRERMVEKLDAELLAVTGNNE